MTSVSEIYGWAVTELGAARMAGALVLADMACADEGKVKCTALPGYAEARAALNHAERMLSDELAQRFRTAGAEVPEPLDKARAQALSAVRLYMRELEDYASGADGTGRDLEGLNHLRTAARDRLAPSITELLEQMRHFSDADAKADVAREREMVRGSLETIREVTEAITMISYNAAIEAQRAGENGKGFAVIAGEVRSLSERARTAVSEVDKHLQP